MKKTYVVILTFMMLILSGCLYPKSELSKNQVPNEAQLDMVQSAVEQYQEDNNGVVPIETKESDVSIYEKYIIDFTKLTDGQYISEIPGTAYENGGVFQYVLVDPEEDVQVKLIDLQVTDKLREVYLKLNEYRLEHTYPPYGEKIAKDVYRLNYEKLGYKNEPYVVSPYSSENLPFVIDSEGDLYVDYRIDLKRLLDEYDEDFEEGQDIRELMTKHTPFVPAYSLPYKEKDGDPVFELD